MIPCSKLPSRGFFVPVRTPAYQVVTGGRLYFNKPTLKITIKSGVRFYSFNVSKKALEWALGGWV